MTYQGHVENGAVVLDLPVPLPEGAKVQVALLEGGVPRDEPPFLDWILELANSIPEEDVNKMPTDASINHDHYLYGTPKVEP